MKKILAFGQLRSEGPPPAYTCILKIVGFSSRVLEFDLGVDLASANLSTRATLANKFRAAIPLVVSGLVSLTLCIHLAESIIDVGNIDIARTVLSVDAVVHIDASGIVAKVVGLVATRPVAACTSPLLQL